MEAYLEGPSPRLRGRILTTGCEQWEVARERARLMCELWPQLAKGGIPVLVEAQELLASILHAAACGTLAVEELLSAGMGCVGYHYLRSSIAYGIAPQGWESGRTVGILDLVGEVFGLAARRPCAEAACRRWQEMEESPSHEQAMQIAHRVLSEATSGHWQPLGRLAELEAVA